MRDVEHVAGSRRISVRGMKPSATPLQRPAPASQSSTANAAGDQHDQRDDQRLDVAEAAVLQEQHDQHVERRQADAPDQRQAEQQVSAIAAPITSARSQAAMAISHRIQSTIVTGASSCRGTPARGRGRWRCRGAPRAPAAGSPSGSRSG